MEAGAGLADGAVGACAKAEPAMAVTAVAANQASRR